MKHDIFVPEHRIEQTLRYIAMENSYCPIQRFLMDCQLEGKEFPYWDNLSQWVLGREDDFATSILQKFLIGAVARGLKPMCTMDWMPILIGKQGCGKSQFCRELVPDSIYGELTLPLEVLVKEMYRLHVAWILELPEVDNYFKRANIENFKNIISVKEDVIRRPYHSELTAMPRRVVMIGTSNRSEFLLDETGNRRFIPLEIRDGYETPWEELREIRGSMWRKAMDEYNKGTEYLISSKEVNAMSDYLHAFAQSDPWEQLIRTYIQDKEEVTITDVLVQGLSFAPERCKPAESRRVSQLLSAIGWRRMVTTRKGQSVRLWRPSETAKETSLNNFL